MYGSQIGRKFDEAGHALRYPGNTVIADVRPGCAAYDALKRLCALALSEGLGECLIALPEDSYHMTVIRGLNDRMRTDGYWPEALDRSAPLALADDAVEAAAARAGLPGGIRMRLSGVRMNEEDLRVLAVPADGEQARCLRAFRDRAADALGLRLPGHDAYTYHITLAYTRVVPEGGMLARARRAVAAMEDALRSAPAFQTSPPYVAFYDDMLTFYPHRIPRGPAKGEKDA